MAHCPFDRRHRTWAMIVLCTLGMVLWPLFVHGESARTMYRAARSRLRIMERAPHRYSRSRWIRLAEQFRRIYYRYPASTYADDAVFFEAEIYARLFRRYHRDDDWNRAVRRYKFLIAEYPYSPHGPRAILTVAELYRQMDRSEWVAFFEQCERLYSTKRCRRESLYTELQRYVRNPEQRALTSGRSRYAVLDQIRYWTSTTYTRIVLNVTRPVRYRTGILHHPDRLYIDLDHTVLSREVRNRVWEMDASAHLQKIRVGQFLPDVARVVFDFDRIKDHRIFVLESPFRIVIDIFQRPWEPASQTRTDAKPSESTPDEPAEPPPVPEANRSGTYSVARQLGMKVARILIDPGHGGRDPGAIGVHGIREKDVTLAIAKRLRDAIQKRWNVEVLLTREDDRFVPLEERTAMANSKGVDLFISIHANASRRNRLRGIETYYLHWAQSERAMEVAARENAITTAKLHELQKYVRLIMQNTKLEESRDLAAYIQKGLYETVRKEFPTRNLGVKTAPFYVLMGAEMPAVLVEVAFLTHPEEGRWLQNERFIDRVVDGIINGLQAYLEAQGSLAWVQAKEK